ncbi:universal stress protein [Streptomyces actinomycinicus]|uniref:universal stress protein n=1 Tax=Streptomyces actinomycinicus TaxID=1695166 RepID=UPI003557655C
MPLDAVRAWRHSLREPAHAEQQQAAELLEEVLRDVPAEPSVHRHAVEGNPRDALVAASREAGLLVVGARRRPGHYGLRLGRVAHGVLHHAACPVAVVPELS